MGDGSMYMGQLVDGKRHGRGVFRSSFELFMYEGEWNDDHRHGNGRCSWEDGRFYKGQFVNGKFEGEGHMEWKTPQGTVIFEGQYVDDLKQGTGKYIWPDGRIYDGEWAQGKRSGKATYISAGGKRREGIWRDDKLERWLSTEGD